MEQMKKAKHLKKVDLQAASRDGKIYHLILTKIRANIIQKLKDIALTHEIWEPTPLL